MSRVGHIRRSLGLDLGLSNLCHCGKLLGKLMVMGSQIVNDHLAFCKKACYAGFAKVTKFSLNTAFSLACGSATHAAAIDALRAV